MREMVKRWCQKWHISEKPGKKAGKRTMGLNRWLSNWRVIRWLIIGLDILLFMILNYLINVCRKLFLWLRTGETVNYGLLNIFPDFSALTHSGLYLGLMIACLIGIVVIDVMLIYQIRVAYSEENYNVGQKGEARWTTLEEIRQQYTEIDEKGTEYDGRPGTLISRYGDKMYIDESPTNNLIIGITRSGKGEMYVYSSIDIYSRSRQRPSLVVNDPKMELYKSSKRTLEQRGYQVYLLNLDDPLHSMGFNPLQLVVETYKQKDYANAELLAQTFAYSIFNPDNAPGESAFFAKTASQLLCALIIAHTEDCLKEDERANKKRLELWQKKRGAYDMLEEEGKAKAREIYLKHKGRDVIEDDIVQFLPPEVKFWETHEYEKMINMYSVINTFTELARIHQKNSQLTALDYYFSKRPAMDRAKLKYASVEVAGDRTKGSIYADMLSELGTFTYENNAKMTAESSINLRDIGFGEKPIAVFMTAPDYDRSNHFLATAFVRQMYFVLAKAATRNKSGRCDRQVKCILDEFGNMPAIENMASIITVCLGRGISFDLYIQAYSQINKLYGDEEKTIIGNCGNQIYILSNDNDTTEAFSKLLGNETITNVQRSGEKLSLNKSLTETFDEKPLLSSNKLQELSEGECVIKRVMKRKDNAGNTITPHPIFNRHENGTAFKYRYTYLTDYFPDPDTVDIDDINMEDRSYVDLKERVWNPEINFIRFNEADERVKRPEQETQETEVVRIENLDKRQQEALKETLEKLLGKDCRKKYGIYPDTPLSRLAEIICNADLKEEEKHALLAVIGRNEIAA